MNGASACTSTWIITCVNSEPDHAAATKDKARRGSGPCLSSALQNVGKGRLLDVSQCIVEADNIGSEILTIRALVLIGTGCLEFVVSAIAVVKVDELNIRDCFREQIVLGPA